MRRRRFIALLGSTTAWALSARAQQPTLPVIGFLDSVVADATEQFMLAFREGLRETGHIEGQNVSIDYRSARGDYDQLPALVQEFLNRRVAVIAASAPPAAIAAKAATSTVPIVFVVGYDPVEYGLVASLDRPGGNVTGATFFGGALWQKRLELLRELAPSATTFVMLVNPNSPTSDRQAKSVLEAVNRAGLAFQVSRVTPEVDLDKVFAAMPQLNDVALLVGGDAYLMSRGEQIVALAKRYRLPAIYDRREYAELGGLMSYGTRLTDAYRQMGVYVGRILKGAKPADLPVVQPTRFELVVNLSAAKALGLPVPQTLQVAADDLIE
jgi:putative tryptophan/tyrosine transport system substrate-binding protein